MRCQNCNRKLDPEEGFLVVKRVQNGLERNLDLTYCNFECMFFHSPPMD